MARIPAARILREGIIPVYVRVEGPRRVRIIRLALDTGATLTMMPHEIARDIGYDPAAEPTRLEISTASGVLLVPVVTVKSVGCLGTTRKNVDVVCHSLPPESPVDGLLGLNFLVHFPPFREFVKTLGLYG